MKHFARFRVTYITAAVAVASAVGAEFTALKDLAPADIHAKTWPFWVAMAAAIIVNAGNTIIAALHPAPEPKPTAPPPFSPQI